MSLAMQSTRPPIIPASGARRSLLVALLAVLGCVGMPSGPSPGKLAASRASVPTPDIEELLSKMTLEEKVGQMTQIDWKLAKNTDDVRKLHVGSVLNGASSLPEPNTPQNWVKLVTSMQTRALSTRLGIPILWGTDAVHGNALVKGATMFPHNIGIGCTRNPELADDFASFGSRYGAPEFERFHGLTDNLVVVGLARLFDFGQQFPGGRAVDFDPVTASRKPLVPVTRARKGCRQSQCLENPVFFSHVINLSEYVEIAYQSGTDGPKAARAFQAVLQPSLLKVHEHLECLGPFFA